MNRSKNGRFARRSVSILAILVVAASAYAGFSVYSGFSAQAEVTYVAPPVVVVPKVVAVETIDIKFARTKDELVESLGKMCETKKVTEPDAAIIFDSNNEASLGSWQFQIKTVQHYVKKFEGRDISRVEAIQTAIDHNRAKALTARILFEEEATKDSQGKWHGGWANWLTCSGNLDLPIQIKLLNKIEK